MHGTCEAMTGDQLLAKAVLEKFLADKYLILVEDHAETTCALCT